jgi:hypothetical protein
MPRFCSFSRLSLALLLLAVLGSVAWAKPKVAILGLEATNAGVADPKDAANAAVLTEALRQIPRGGNGKFEFAPNSNRELQDEKLMNNCASEAPGCMAPIGTGVGADVLIFGNIVKITDKAGKETYKVKLTLLSVKPPPKAEDPSETFVPLGIFNSGPDAAKEPAKEWAIKAYSKLTNDKQLLKLLETGPGKLVINSNAKSGDVFVDSEKKGRLEGGTITLTLAEGDHVVAIEAPGYKRYQETVTIKGGPAKTIEAQLDEVLGPPPGGKSGAPTALKLTGYGLAGVGVGAGAYALYLTFFGPIQDYYNQGAAGLPIDKNDVRVTEAKANRCDEPDLRDVQAHTENRFFDEACKANTRRNVAIAVGIAGGVLGAGALLFAYRSDGKSMEKQAAGKRTRRQFTVTPVISPNGGGATVRFDW